MRDEKSAENSKQPEALAAESGSAPPAIEQPAGTPAPMSPSNDKWLWVDPYLTEDNLKKRPIVGSVLLSDDILNYIENYNVLVENADFQSGKNIRAKLKGASYTMTPDENGAWIYMPSKSDGEDTQITIKPEQDDKGDYYLVPKNSLVYIKIKQKLRIPFYIIGRHNLKIRYVYQGLLLGTGPQVDPGFCGNLIIPLHNFTTKDVKIYIKESFISIDFTRTTELSFGDRKIPSTIDELYEKFGSEKHLIERTKVTERNSISKYLEGATPRSQMGQFLFQFTSLENKIAGDLKTLEDRVNKSIEDSKKFSHWERLTVMIALGAFTLSFGALIYASVNIYRGLASDLNAEVERNAAVSKTTVSSIESRISGLETSQAVTTDGIRNQLSELMVNAQNIQIAAKSNQLVFEDQMREYKKFYDQYKREITNTNNSTLGPKGQ